MNTTVITRPAIFFIPFQNHIDEMHLIYSICQCKQTSGCARLTYVYTYRCWVDEKSDAKNQLNFVIPHNKEDDRIVSNFFEILCISSIVSPCRE